MCGFLPKDMEVISLDLPGHGETTTSDDDDLSVEGQADAVHDFVSHAGIDTTKLHLCGQSMGGSIAGTYASKYHDSLSMLTLLCPATRTPKLSKFMESVLDGGDIHDWLLPETEEQVQKNVQRVYLQRQAFISHYSQGSFEFTATQKSIFHATVEGSLPLSSAPRGAYGEVFKSIETGSAHLG